MVLATDAPRHAGALRARRGGLAPLRDEDVASYRRHRDEAMAADERAGNIAALMYGAVAMPVNAA